MGSDSAFEHPFRKVRCVWAKAAAPASIVMLGAGTDAVGTRAPEWDGCGRLSEWDVVVVQGDGVVDGAIVEVEQAQ